MRRKKKSAFLGRDQEGRNCLSVWVGAALACSPVLFYLGSPGEGWLFQPSACSIALYDLSPGSQWEEGREDAKEDRDRTPSRALMIGKGIGLKLWFCTCKLSGIVESLQSSVSPSVQWGK